MFQILFLLGWEYRGIVNRRPPLNKRTPPISLEFWCANKRTPLISGNSSAAGEIFEN